MGFVHLAGVFRVPIARTALIAAGVVVVGQFEASTFVTPFLEESARIGSDLATVIFLGYGLAGIAGTLLGSGLVARAPLWTFVGVPLLLHTLMLTATPDSPEASSAMFITVSQLAIVVGSAVGGVLVDLGWPGVGVRRQRASRRSSPAVRRTHWSPSSSVSG